MNPIVFRDPRDEYTRSKTKIGLRALAAKWKAFGFSLDKIRRRSNKENWTAERLRVQEEIRTKAIQKSIGVTSTTAANEMSRVVEGSRGGIRICKSAIDFLLAKLEEVEKKTGKPANPLNLSLSQAVDLLERLARINFIASRISEGGTGGTYEELLREALRQFRSVSVDLRIQATKGNGSTDPKPGEVVKEAEKIKPNGSNGNGNGASVSREDRRFLL